MHGFVQPILCKGERKLDVPFPRNEPSCSTCDSLYFWTSVWSYYMVYCKGYRRA